MPHLPPPGSSSTRHVRVPVSIERVLGAAAMALICLISFGNVVVRYTTNISFAFTEEFSVFLLVFMTFVGAALAFASGSHIRIGFIADRWPGLISRCCEALAVLASCLMFALVIYYGAELTLDQYQFEETSPGLGYPAWMYTVWVPVLSVVIILRLLGRYWASLRGRL
jgi:TRAP-type C4-dicarboxylate transport system permease small subunit